MNAITRTALSVFAITALLAGCKSTGTKTSETDKISQEEITQGIEEVIFPLPEPMGVYQMLQDIGAEYSETVLNDVNSVEKYFASNVKAVNLGVYAADLSYVTVYDKKDDVDSYTNTLKVLIDDLGVKVDYNTLLSDETRAKAENLDSLVKITSDVFYDTYEFLYNESDPSLAALMVNGFYIEGLYIATHISEQTFGNLEMVKIIYDQKKPLEALIDVNKKFEDNELVKALQGALLKLKALYDETDGSLNEEQLKAITTTIESIRNSQVS